MLMRYTLFNIIAIITKICVKSQRMIFLEINFSYLVSFSLTVSYITDFVYSSMVRFVSAHLMSKHFR